MPNHKYTLRSVVIPLTKHQVTYVDIIDADLALLQWRSDGKGYAYYWADKRTQVLHRIILERILGRSLNKGEVCDHINGKRNDNRRNNLRVTTYAGNNRNSKMRKGNSSGFKGVWKVGNRWRACIKVNKKKIYLGYFGSPEEAHQAYCNAALKYHGEFARFK